MGEASSRRFYPFKILGAVQRWGEIVEEIEVLCCKNFVANGVICAVMPPQGPPRICFMKERDPC